MVSSTGMTPKEDVFVHKVAIKKNPRKYLCSVGYGETVEYDVVEGEKVMEAANDTGPGGFLVKAVNMQQTITIIDTIHVTGILHAITRIVKVRKRMRDRRGLLKARPNSAGPIPRSPTPGDGYHCTICRDPLGIAHSIPTFLCRDK